MEEKKQDGWIARGLRWIERSGNKMPDPVMVFIILIGVILLASWLFSMLGTEVIHPGTEEVIQVENLLSRPYIIRMIEEAVSNFTAFPALGLVLVVMLGIGLAEESGYFEVLLTSVVEKAPQKLVIWIIIFAGILGNIAGDAAPIVIPPLAAIIFMKMGLHPVAGAIVGYAAPLGAFAANLIPGMSDALVFAFTEPAAELVQSGIELNVLMNYYFIAASTPVLLFVIYWILTRYTLPQMGTYEVQGAEQQSEREVTGQERSALKWANWSFVLFLIGLAVLTIPQNGILRNQETGSVVNDSPLMNGIGIIMTAAFFIPGLVYALRAGEIEEIGRAHV